MAERQKITEGCRVFISGYEFVATDVRVEEILDAMTDDVVDERVVFIGVCTDDPRNDPIRNTGYNGGEYGGNRLAYDF